MTLSEILPEFYMQEDVDTAVLLASPLPTF